MEDSNKYILQDKHIAVADCHELVLVGMECILTRHGVKAVDLYKSEQELLQAIEQQHYDLYITDIQFIDRKIPTLITSIRKLHPDALILVNTMIRDLPLFRRIIDQHVNGIIFRNKNSIDIVNAIDSILHGKQYFCKEFKKMADESGIMQEQPSQREIDVIEAMAKGLTSKEIAEQLFISENTVEAHRKNLFFKLKARNIADLIVKAISRGYINPSEI
jgi:DNA-binding NarL/FixJ family response regulator